MLDDRTPARCETTTTPTDAERKVDEALRLVARDPQAQPERGLARPPGARSSRPASTCRNCWTGSGPTRPTASTPAPASSAAHLSSLLGVRPAVPRHPAQAGASTSNPAVLLRGGEEAFRRFTEFTFDSVRLVNQGDLAAVPGQPGDRCPAEASRQLGKESTGETAQSPLPDRAGAGAGRLRRRGACCVTRGGGGRRRRPSRSPSTCIGGSEKTELMADPEVRADPAATSTG